MYCQSIMNSIKPEDAFRSLANERYCFWLDSADNSRKTGRYSMLGANPLLVLRTRGSSIQIEENGQIKEFEENPFTALRRLVKRYQLAHVDCGKELPFYGGWVGSFAYDLCHQIERLPRFSENDLHTPDIFFAFYHTVVVFDSVRKEAFVVSNDFAESPTDEAKALTAKLMQHQRNTSSAERKWGKVSLESNMTMDEYLQSVCDVKNYIAQGDIYQVNIAQRFVANMPTSSPGELYLRLRKQNPGPFCAYLDIGETQILSSSPERFLQIEHNWVQTRPIKGTRPRGRRNREDLRNRIELMKCRKERAELLMIVDLMRNDLGRICEAGTIMVPKLYAIESYSTVHHLVGEVVGRLKPECDFVDCIKATFPGGSITGAPKIRAMEIIDQLESKQRQMFTGSLGYLGIDGRADFNILIRTMLCNQDRVYFQVGSGIVWDSVPMNEYQETLHKAKGLFKALGAKWQVS